MANAFVHGKLTTIQIASTYFAALTADYNEELSDLTDITYTQVSGATWRILLPGYNQVGGTIGFVYDTLNQPVLSPQNQIPGTLMSLIFSPDGTKLYTLTAYSQSLSIPGGPQVKGPVAAKCAWMSSGVVTRPTS